MPLTSVDRKRRNRIKNIVGLILFPIVLFVLLRWFEHSVAFYPMRQLAGSPSDLQRSFEDVLLDSGKHRIHAWYFPATNSEPHNEKVFLVSHGNAGNISHRLPLAAILLQSGAGVLLYDYRGYGKSAGKPSEAAVYEDANAAYDFLIGKGVAATNIIAFGESLGGAVSVELASQRPVGGLVVLSSFSSIRSLGQELFPWFPAFLSSLRFESEEKIRQVHAPTVILHSKEDTIIPFHHGQKLFTAANEPKFFQEVTGDHNDTYETSGAELLTASATLFRMMDESRDR